MARDFLQPSEAQVTLVNSYFSDGSDGSNTLDSAAEKYGSPDFIKMDIEGAEADVLKSADSTLAGKPRMIIETHGETVERECITILTNVGYKIEIVNRSKLFSEARGLEHNRWLICH